MWISPSRMVKTHRQRCGFKQRTMVVQNRDLYWKNADLASEHGETDGNIGDLFRYNGTRNIYVDIVYCSFTSG